MPDGFKMRSMMLVAKLPNRLYLQGESMGGSIGIKS